MATLDRTLVRTAAVASATLEEAITQSNVQFVGEHERCMFNYGNEGTQVYGSSDRG